MSEDYYALLGVDPAASEEAILQAYREKAAEHHPDVSDADDAESTFQRLKEAKDVLTDEERRREYDRVGHDQYLADSQTRRSPGQATARPRTHAGWQANRSGWPGGFGSLLEEFFGASTGWSSTRERQSSGSRKSWARDPLVIDLEARIRGQEAAGPSDPAGADPGQVNRSAQGQSNCPRCGGRGRFVHEIDTVRGRTRRLEPCERCGGSGAVDDTE